MKRYTCIRRLLISLVVMATGGYLSIVLVSKYHTISRKTAVTLGPRASNDDRDLKISASSLGLELESKNQTRINENVTPADKVHQQLLPLVTPKAMGSSVKQENENTKVETTPTGTTPNPSTKAAEKAHAQECSEVRRPSPNDIVYRHKYWQALTDGVEDVVLFSAFYDNRPIVGALPWLRILGVRKVCAVSNQNLFCHVWYSTQVEPFVVKADVVASGRINDVRGGLRYGQYQFSCQLEDAERVPTHVSLVINRCSSSTVFLPVVVPERSPVAGRWMHEFSLCAEVNFGSIPAAELVEWIELNVLFGVRQFYIYNGNFTDATTVAVLEHYGHQGLVQLIPMPPSVEDYSIDGVRLASPASLNDCMLRSMYTSRFVVVIDLDEIIVPRLHSNYSQLIDHVDRTLQLKESYHTYSFRNAYFFTYFPSDDTQPSFLKTSRLRYRAPPGDYLFGAKSFVDPRRCLSVFNHYCWVHFRGTHDPRFGTSVDVPPDLGLSQHYRGKCPEGLGKERCDGYSKDKVKDDIMLKFRPVVEPRVKAVLQMFKLL